MSRWLRDERGATLVLVAFLFLAFLAVAAVAVDAARIIVDRNQMQIASDAGALAGALTVIRGDTSDALDTAKSYALANYADTSAMAGDSAVVFGSWDPVAGTFEARSDPSVSNAVRVRTSRSASHLMAWALDAADIEARAGAIAMFATAITGSTCVKSFAVARELIDTNEDGIITLEERELAYGVEHVLIPAESPSDAPSFYYAVVLPPFYDASTGTYRVLTDSMKSAEAYEVNLATCNPDLIGVGDSIYTKPGKNFGNTRDGLYALCGYVDPPTGLCNPTGAYSSDGLPGIPVISPLWDSRVAPIGRDALEVTDVAALRITRVEAKASVVEVSGFFMKMVDGGEAEPGLGLMERPLLVR